MEKLGLEQVLGTKDPTAPIGVFDSGVGGLTVAREIMRQIPNERLVYFGDTARVPYGSKSKKTVLKYSKQIVRFLKTKNVNTIHVMKDWNILTVCSAIVRSMR